MSLIRKRQVQSRKRVKTESTCPQREEFKITAGLNRYRAEKKRAWEEENFFFASL